MIVEICASNFESALAARNGGADRIELCCSLEVGGLTPPADMLKKVRDEINIPVHVLVRPREGDFVYSEAELNEMIETISRCRALGCSGIVGGALTPEGAIDIRKTNRLIKASADLQFTFHRAFDLCNDPFSALEQLVDMGVHTLLTSGLRPTALQGLETLSKLKEISGGRVVIMPGAGINDGNAAYFIDQGFDAIHLSAIRKGHFKPNSILSGVEGVSDVNMIQRIVTMTH